MAALMFEAGALRRLCLFLIAVSLAFRLWLAAVLPITGDEAYFIEWGLKPDWGFYDHPPMVGWWLAALLQVSHDEWWLRLPVVLQPALLALATQAFLRAPADDRQTAPADDTAWFAALLVLLAPANVWNVLITTDTPLIYFSFFSALAFIRAARDDDPRFYLLAGVLLGGAFLSKYFSVLLGLAYALHALWRPSRRKLTGLLLVMAGATFGPALNIWWNIQHCWSNIMFNLFNRHDGNTGFGWKTPLLYLAMMLYLLTPIVLWHLARLRIALSAMWHDAQSRAMMLIAGAPLALFAGLSLVKTIGAHWVLSFVPFVMMLFARALPETRRPAAVRFFGGFAALHVLLIGLVALLPVETWARTRQYDGIVMTVKPQELLARLRPFERDYHFAADGYSPAVTMSYNAQRYFSVFGPGSSHARHDDILTDFRQLDARNILILRKSAPDLAAQYAPYFREVEVREIEVRGANFWIVLGRVFNYAAYRDGVLEPIRQRWYAVPAWLPMTQCYFCERYFPQRACRTGGD
jgi:hypothetical protein